MRLGNAPQDKTGLDASWGMSSLDLPPSVGVGPVTLTCNGKALCLDTAETLQFHRDYIILYHKEVIVCMLPSQSVIIDIVMM